MDLFSNFSKNSSMITEIGMIEVGSPPVRRPRVGHTKARWDVVDVEVISIGKPMEILSGRDPTFKHTYHCDCPPERGAS